MAPSAPTSACAHRPPRELRALQWLQRFGPKACLLSWLPVVGDPLCAVAGWLRCRSGPAWSTWPSASSLRYVTMTAALLWVFPGQFNPEP